MRFKTQNIVRAARQIQHNEFLMRISKTLFNSTLGKVLLSESYLSWTQRSWQILFGKTTIFLSCYCGGFKSLFVFDKHCTFGHIQQQFWFEGSQTLLHHLVLLKTSLQLTVISLSYSIQLPWSC